MMMTIKLSSPIHQAGILEPAYALQQDMNNAVAQTFEDGDLTLMLTEVNRIIAMEGSFLEKVQSVKTPIVMVVNKPI